MVDKMGGRRDGARSHSTAAALGEFFVCAVTAEEQIREPSGGCSPSSIRPSGQTGAAIEALPCPR
jgi:hypothetical protein